MIAAFYNTVAIFTVLLSLIGLLDKNSRRSTYVLLGAVGLSAGALIVWLAAVTV
jgi:hypothetical protein